jgi:hypothetical protein
MARKRRTEIQNQLIQSSKQPADTGCMYYSFMSLTGDASLLQYADDNSYHRFLIRVMDAGYLLVPIYCNHFQTADECFFWQLHFRKCTEEGVARQQLLVTCSGLGKGNTLHVVAMLVDFAGGIVTVADPMRDGLPSWPLSDFIKQSPYAPNTIEISALESAVLDDYATTPPTKSKP